MNEQNPNLFNSAIALLRATAEETARRIPPEESALFVGLSNDAIDILGAVQNAYPLADLQNSLVVFDSVAIHQQLFGMGLDFLCGRYAEVGRGLRFAWESIFRAFYADQYLILKPGASNPPPPKLDDKTAWLETQNLNWNTILSVLRRLFPPASDGELLDQFRPIWKRLNAVAHPSVEWRESGVGESVRHTWFHFDESLARQLLADAREVFTLIWLALLRCFPKATSTALADPNTFADCPKLRALLA
jgi:hypothetical protein